MGETDFCDRSDLCQELSGSDDTEFLRTYPHLGDRILVESANAVALADLSPLTAGHILVCPRIHYFSAAEALSRSAEFYPFLLRVLDQYEITFGNYTILEHGSFEGMAGSACISHAHLHILPIPILPVLSRLRADGVVLEQRQSWGDLLALADNQHPYFLAATGDGLYIAEDPAPMVSQYLRVVAGSVLDIPAAECDWAVVIRRQLLQQTLNRWRAPTNQTTIG